MSYYFSYRLLVLVGIFSVSSMTLRKLNHFLKPLFILIDRFLRASYHRFIDIPKRGDERKEL